MTRDYILHTVIELYEAMYLVQLMNDYIEHDGMVEDEARKLSPVYNQHIKWADCTPGYKCGYIDEEVVKSYMDEFKDIEYWEFRNISTGEFNIGDVIMGTVPSGLQYEMNTDSYFDETHIKFANVRCYKMCSIEGHLVVFFGMTDKSADVLKTIEVYGG